MLLALMASFHFGCSPEETPEKHSVVDQNKPKKHYVAEPSKPNIVLFSLTTSTPSSYMTIWKTTRTFEN
jgi:hypothetical protein